MFGMSLKSPSLMIMSWNSKSMFRGVEWPWREPSGITRWKGSTSLLSAPGEKSHSPHPRRATVPGRKNSSLPPETTNDPPLLCSLKSKRPHKCMRRNWKLPENQWRQNHSNKNRRSPNNPRSKVKEDRNQRRPRPSPANRDTECP